MTELIILVHAQLASAVMIYVAVAGVWGVAEGLFGPRKAGEDEGSKGSSRLRSLSGSYGAILALAEGLLVVQGVAGAYTLLAGSVPRDMLHVVYGVVAAGLLPVAYVLLGRYRRLSLWMGLTCFVIFAALLRALSTGA